MLQNSWGEVCVFCHRPSCFLFPHIRIEPDRVSPNQCHSRYIKGLFKAIANLESKYQKLHAGLGNCFAMSEINIKVVIPAKAGIQNRLMILD